MIHYVTGDILESNAQALVNTVNTMGVMGKGIALQFKNQYPNNYKVYKERCEAKALKVGELLVTVEESLLTGTKTIINFPTKTNWRLPSEYEYIALGLEALKKVITEKGINSIAIPPLGAGNGGLDWQRVKKMILEALSELDIDIYIYEPSASIQEALKTERVPLTPARAMLLSVLYDMVRHGELVSEFAAEKAAYFLQRFGAKNAFQLTFRPNFFGPYSGKVRHVLYYLNGSYVMGYSAKDKKPFDELSLIMEAEPEIIKFLEKAENQEYKAIAHKTKQFLKGFYSPFGLELLSTIDFISSEKQKYNTAEILAELENWSERKKTMFANPVFVEKAITKIKSDLS